MNISIFQAISMPSVALTIWQQVAWHAARKMADIHGLSSWMLLQGDSFVFWI